MYEDKDLKWFDRMNLRRPTHTEHGLEDTVENPLSKQLIRFRTSNWRRDGNMLVCDTDNGPLTQYLDPAYIVLGTDDDGLPILKKV